MRGFIRRERTCIIDCGNLVFSYERSHKGRLHYQYMTMEFTIGNDYRMKNWATAILSEGKRKTRPSKRCLAARLASESAFRLCAHSSSFINRSRFAGLLRTETKLNRKHTCQDGKHWVMPFTTYSESVTTYKCRYLILRTILTDFL